MNIYAVISNEDLQSNIVNFIKLIKNINFSFVKLNEINNLKNKTIFFIIDSKTNNRSLKIIENNILKHKAINFIYFIPFAFKQNITNKNLQCIFYPLKISDFEKKLINFLNINNLSYSFLKLTNQNLLVNKKNKKQIYLTESEAKILKLLFIHKVANIDTIKFEALNLRPDVESKSLETHLYRLRKKLAIIYPGKPILSVDMKTLKILNIS